MPFQEFACNGLWVASGNGDYKDRIWIRDSVFIILAHMEMGATQIVQDALDTIATLWDVSLEDSTYARPSICYSRDLKPVGVPNYLTGESADIQNDTLGEILWLYCEAHERGYNFTPSWDRVIKNILDTLFEERYWEQEDAGFWEMEPALRASSVGICVSGLRRLLLLDATKQWSSSWDADRVRTLLEKGYETLYKLLPNETSNRAYDSALLFLIWPFVVVDGSMALHILGRALGNLRGWVSFRRFPNDPYYLRGGEIAEWGMTSPHMLLCVNQIGLYPVEEDPKDWKPIKLLEEKNYPESFVGLEKEPNSNTPLAWTKAMCLLAKLKLRYDDNPVD